MRKSFVNERNDKVKSRRHVIIMDACDVALMRYDNRWQNAIRERRRAGS